MKHFKISTAASAMMAVSFLWASTGEAQVFKKPKVTKTQTVKQPIIPQISKQEEEELQLLQITNPEEYSTLKPVLHLSEAPKIMLRVCTISYVTITPKSYIFQCSSKRTRHDNSYSRTQAMWVIRRDGSQPRWALPADDADRIYDLMSEKLKIENGHPVEYWMYTKKDSRADNRYCNRNTLDLTNAKPLSEEEKESGSYQLDWIQAKYAGHNDYYCYDIMSVTRLQKGYAPNN